MITKAQNSSGCESKVYNITSESCFDKRVEDFRIKEIEFNPITKKLVIKQSPDVIISTDILQLNDVTEPTHLSPVEDIVDNIPGSAKNGISYILRVEDKYYHCTWRDTLKYWDRVQLKDGYEFFNKKDSTEYRYNDGALVDISTIHLSMRINSDNIQILNSSGDGVTLPVATQTTPGLFSKEDKTKLDSITKYVKEISFSGADTLVLDIVSSDGTESLPIREANINQNGLMSKEACLNLSRLLNIVNNEIYTKEEVQKLLESKVDVAPGKDLLDTSQIFKINQIYNYVENVEYLDSNNRASIKVTTKDPTIGQSSSKILSFPDTSSAISGLMSPKYKDYIDSLKSYYTGDTTKEYTGQELQIIFPIYDPISKQLTSKYLVLDAATSSTAGLITAMEKNKLGNISSIIQAVSDNTYNSNSVVLNLTSNNPQTGTEEPVQIVFKSATPEKAGVMSSSDKGKLDNVVKYLTELTDTKTTSATQAIIHYQSYNPFLNSYEDKYYSLPMATSTIAGSITSTDFDVIQGLKDVNGNPLTYEGTPSKTWKIGDRILKNEKEGFSVRNEDDTEYGDLIVRNLTIKEDIVFGGDAFIIDTEEVKVTDNILTLNSGEQGEGVTKGISGLEIDRGKLPNYFIIFDESDDRFKCGTEGNQFPLMLRDNEPDMVDGAFLTWNSTFKRAQTTSTVPIQLALRFALQNLSEKDTDLIFKRVDNDLYLQYGNSNDKYLSLRVLDDILFKSSPSATKYIFDKEIWAPAFKRDDGYESAYLDTNIEDRKFLQYNPDKKLIYSSNMIYADRGSLNFAELEGDTNFIRIINSGGDLGIVGIKNYTTEQDIQTYFSFIISSDNLTPDENSELLIYTDTHKAFTFGNPIIIGNSQYYIGFQREGVRISNQGVGFVFTMDDETITLIPSPERAIINTSSPELAFSSNIIIPTGFRTSDRSQILFADYSKLNKNYLTWDSNTNTITSIDGYDSLVAVNPDDPNKKVTLVYTKGGFIITSSSDVSGVPQNTLELSETVESNGSVIYNLNSTYTPLHVDFPMWGNFCDGDGKPFATVESLVGHYLPLSAGSTNALTGPLYFSPISALVNKTDTGENTWALFMGDSTNGTSLYLGSFGEYETLIGGDLGNTALLNIDNSGNNYVTRLGYTDADGNIKSGIITSGNDQNSQTTIHTIGDNDIKHYKNGAEYTVYDTSNLNVEELLLNYTLEGNIIGTPKATRIKSVSSSSFGDNLINKFPETIWGSNSGVSWVVPFRSGSADPGTAGAHAASLGWAIGDTHAYLSVAHEGNIMKAVIGGGDSGKITWYKELAFKDDISDLSTVYYPYNGRGQMSISADGRPVLSNTYGILFKQTRGEWVEGIYMGSHNMIVVGGPSGTNVPVIIYSKLNVNSISTTREQLGLLSYHPTDWTGVSNTQVGVGTTDSQLVLRSNSSDLLHYRDGVHCLIFDSYNFSRNLGTTSLNSSFNHFPMMAAQIKSGDATTDRGYPIQEAGSLVVIPGTYHGSSQIYGTYSTNRWFVRGGSNSLEDPTAHTPWKELATTNHLSNYLPLTGGTLTGSLFIGSPSQNAYNFIRIQRNNYILETTVSEDNGILSFSNLNNTSATSKLKISPGGHAYINDEELAKVSQIPSMSGYLPLTGGTMSGNIRIPYTSWIEQIHASGSNATPFIKWLSDDASIIMAQIGHHTMGGPDDTGSIYIIPRAITSTPWDGTNGLFIYKGGVKIDGEELAKVSQIPSTSDFLPLSGGVLSGSDRIVLRINSPSSAPAVDLIFSIGNSIKGGIGFESGTLGTFLSDGVNDKVFCLKNGPEIRTNSGTLIGEIPYKSDLDKYLPLSGGTLTRTTAGPVLSLKNTSANKEAYMDFYKGSVRCGYIGASASNSEDMYLLSYGSRNVIIGTAQGFTRLESGANNLIHRRSGTDYTILDTYNIASLTIQFNGSTNTTYAPNAAKTVNITPAAIGAAASSHTHTTLQGTYTGSGGSQPPSYITAGTLRANMMYYNMSGSPYCDWIMMDTYTGSDVPYVTMIGVTKTATPRAFIASGPKGNASTSSWVRKELATVDAIPTTMAWGSITGAPATVTRWPSWSEVTSKPSFATVATSGSYNDLSNRPSIPSAETAATIMSKINSQSEITFSKHVVCSAGAGLQSTSDIRFKSNFNSLPDNTLNKVLNAPEFTYNWKDEKTTSIGTSAQYWEDKIPTLVHEMEDGTKTFSYERYTVVLQKALKEEHRLREEEKKRFKEEIDSLNTRLNDLTLLIQKLI